MGYQQDCLRTMPEGLSGMEILTMCALGLAGETAEARVELRYRCDFKNLDGLLLEIGDCMYYAAVGLHELCVELPAPGCHVFSAGILGASDVKSVEYELNAAARCAGGFADIVKKWRYHGHVLDVEAAAMELVGAYRSLCRAAGWLGVGVDEVQAMNVQKLRVRYPEGFSTERSINRTE